MLLAPMSDRRCLFKDRAGAGLEAWEEWGNNGWSVREGMKDISNWEYKKGLGRLKLF